MNIWKNNNTLGRYRESLPLEDRDDYAEWKKSYDYENTSSYKRSKFRNQLDTKRNKEGVRNAWRLFGLNIMDYFHGESFANIDNDEEVSEFSPGVLGINIGYNLDGDVNKILYLSTNTKDKVSNFEDCINSVLKSKKMTVRFSFLFNSYSFDRGLDDVKHYINMYSKEMIENEYPRKNVGETKKFLMNFKKVMQPEIKELEEDFGLSVKIENPYINSDYKLSCDFSCEIPYNFGIEDNDTAKMTGSANGISDCLINIGDFIIYNQLDNYYNDELA